MLLITFYFYKIQSISIIVQASKGFNNYRHMTNLRILNDLSGDQPILNFFAEDLFQDNRNIDKSKVYIDEKKYLPYKKLKRHGHSIKDFLNVLYCNTKKMKGIEQANALVYITGHGNDGVFKFHDREWLCRDDLMDAILFLSTKVLKVLLIIDTCQAETMIKRNELPQNVFAVTTSVRNESSISDIHNSFIGVSTIDNFIYYLYDVINNITSDLSLVDFFTKIKNRPVGSTLTFSFLENFYISDFFLNSPVCSTANTSKHL